MSRTDRAAVEKLSKAKPRYCWRVPLRCEFVEDMPHARARRTVGVLFVFVDVETGKVILIEQDVF